MDSYIWHSGIQEFFSKKNSPIRTLAGTKLQWTCNLGLLHHLKSNGDENCYGLSTHENLNALHLNKFCVTLKPCNET